MLILIIFQFVCGTCAVATVCLLSCNVSKSLKYDVATQRRLKALITFGLILELGIKISGRKIRIAVVKICVGVCDVYFKCACK